MSSVRQLWRTAPAWRTVLIVATCASALAVILPAALRVFWRAGQRRSSTWFIYITGFGREQKTLANDTDTAVFAATISSASFEDFTFWRFCSWRDALCGPANSTPLRELAGCRVVARIDQDRRLVRESGARERDERKVAGPNNVDG